MRSILELGRWRTRNWLSRERTAPALVTASICRRYSSIVRLV